MKIIISSILVFLISLYSSSTYSRITRRNYVIALGHAGERAYSLHRSD